MQQPLFGPKTALFLIFVLWGIAGALEQPQNEPDEPTEPIRLQCHAHQGDKHDNSLDRRPKSGMGLVSYYVDRLDAIQQSRSSTLLCHVIDN
jgi:hypothetical protein